MNNTVASLSVLNLTVAFLPVMAVLVIFYKWSLDTGKAMISISRMLIQLLLVGYFLTALFATEHSWIVMLVMLVMVTAASWISLNTIKSKRKALFGRAFWSILTGGGVTLILVTQWVINIDPWFEPRFMIPLGGMIFANSMNSVSLAAERLNGELAHGDNYLKARNIAFQAAFIPQINTMLAVGLVSLPGMMTGQILSGISPVIAAQYQIVVMCMIFGSAGLSTAYFLILAKPVFHSSS